MDITKEVEKAEAKIAKVQDGLVKKIANYLDEKAKQLDNLTRSKSRIEEQIEKEQREHDRAQRLLGEIDR